MTDRNWHGCTVPDRFKARVLRVFTGNVLAVVSEDNCAVMLRVAGLEGPVGPEGDEQREALENAIGWMAFGHPLRVMVRERVAVGGEVYGVVDLYVVGPNIDLVNIRDVMKARRPWQTVRQPQFSW